MKIYVPGDSGALALGADRVAAAVEIEATRKGIRADLVRNGSRGLYWLEPMVEMETEEGRVAYGSVSPRDVAPIFDLGKSHPRFLGRAEEIPYLKNQQRLTFSRSGITVPLSIEDYIANEGFSGLVNALKMTGAAIVSAVTESGLRGRGGAAFPTGIKWKTVLEAESDLKYVVCNADEGDSGTFSDRMVMENDPFMLMEGMIIAGLATGASYGYIYVRSEYPHACSTLLEAAEILEKAGYLGESVLDSDKSFHIEVRRAAGSYVCGEETAMLESMEGRRGIVRAKPPLPAISGLFGKPTVINNVISFSAVPFILANGAEAYRNYGTGRSRGTLPIQLAGNVKHGGLIERAFGVTLNELIYEYGGGTASGRPVRAVQVGGPLGAYIPESLFDTQLDYEAFIKIGGTLGHGGIVVFDDSVDMMEQARYAMEFCAIESCGKCTPCRIGSVRGMEVIDGIASGSQQIGLLRDLCDTMLNGSLCAMGGMTPYPVLSALNHFPEDFAERRKK